MSVNFFVDTNILVYSRDASDSKKQKQASQWLAKLWELEQGRISTQILNEYYIVVTGKLKPGLTKEQARADIRALSLWQPLDITPVLITSAWEVQDRYGYSWWDTLVITAALTLNCRYLLSEDMQHQQQIDSLTIINPFIMTPDDLL